MALSQFSKIYNCPDIQAALAQCWPLLGQMAPEAALAKMDHWIRLLYAILYEPDFAFDHVYPTRSAHGALAEARA